jgi:hypothetical protein
VVDGDKIEMHGDGNIGKIVALQRRRRTVLVLMSNPRGTAGLRLDEEYRAIDEAILKARHGDRLELRPGAAVRHGDLQGLLLRHRPTVVHYSGHNHGEAGIVLADDRGKARPVAPEALSGLFRIMATSIRLVVLNACLTQDQAAAIAAHVPCVIGMSRAVRDDVAIAFASAFYHAAASREPVAAAFGLASNRLGFDTGGTYRDLAPTAGDPLPPQMIPVMVGDPGVAKNLFITS